MCVFHSIRFKVNKGWATAVALFFVFMRKTPLFFHLFFNKYCRFWYIIEKCLYLCTIIKNLEDAITKEYRQKVFGFAS